MCILAVRFLTVLSSSFYCSVGSCLWLLLLLMLANVWGCGCLLHYPPFAAVVAVNKGQMTDLVDFLSELFTKGQM